MKTKLYTICFFGYASIANALTSFLADPESREEKQQQKQTRRQSNQPSKLTKLNATMALFAVVLTWSLLAFLACLLINRHQELQQLGF
jgi:hypothetical protein